MIKKYIITFLILLLASAGWAVDVGCYTGANGDGYTTCYHKVIGSPFVIDSNMVIDTIKARVWNYNTSNYYRCAIYYNPSFGLVAVSDSVNVGSSGAQQNIMFPFPSSVNLVADSGYLQVIGCRSNITFDYITTVASAGDTVYEDSPINISDFPSTLTPSILNVDTCANMSVTGIYSSGAQPQIIFIDED